MDFYKKIQRGDSMQAIPARVYNALLHEVAGVDIETTADALGSFRQAGVLKVKNLTGADQPRFAVLGLGAPIVTPTANLKEFKRRPTFLGARPAAATHKNKIAILQQPLRKGSICDAVAAGVSIVRVTGAAADFAELIDGDATKLQCQSSGSARILWAESGSADRWAIVRLESFSTKIGAAARATFSTFAFAPNLQFEVANPAGFIDPNHPERMVIPVDGFYSITAGVLWNSAPSSVSDQRQIDIVAFISGLGNVSLGWSQVAATAQTVCAMKSLTAGVYLTLGLVGPGLNVPSPNLDANFLAAVLVG